MSEPSLALLPCGHAEVTRGCGGCDAGAIEFVITDDGVRRPFDPARDMAAATDGYRMGTDPRPPDPDSRPDLAEELG